MLINMSVFVDLYFKNCVLQRCLSPQNVQNVKYFYLYVHFDVENNVKLKFLFVKGCS